MSAAKTTLICDNCGQAFGKKPSLIKHMKNKHPRGATFKTGDQEYPIIAGAQQGNFECPIYRSQLSGRSGLRRLVVKCSANCDADPRLESDSERSEAGDSDHYEEDGDYGETNTRENDVSSILGSKQIISGEWQSAHDVTRYADIDLVRRQITAANLRPHLSVLRNDHDHGGDDDNDEDDAGFLPGSAAVKAKEDADHTPVPVQPFYARTGLRPQLACVEVTEAGEGQPRVQAGSTLLGIPADLDDVGGHDLAVEARDRNQFDDKFGAYHLIDLIDFEELSPWFPRPNVTGFDLLKKLTIAYIQDCWAYFKAGFQPLQAKIMKFDDDKQFFHAVQQHQTVAKYGERNMGKGPVARVHGCQAASAECRSYACHSLTEQTESATRLLHLIENFGLAITGEHSNRISA
ncbi:hypothetical protein V1506DRAFT_507614 [Lipomyces tetrasporus]